MASTKMSNKEKQKIVVPLTARNQALEEIEILKQGFDLLSDLVTITDNNGIILYANEAVEKSTGFSMTEVIGKNSGDLWGGNMEEEFFKEMWHTIKIQKKTFIGEVINKKKDGTKSWHELRIYPVVDAKSEIKFFIGIQPDITNRKKIEKDLEDAKIAARNVLEDLQTEKEELARAKVKDDALLESIGEGVIATDNNGKIILMNPAAEAMLGWKLDEAVGKLLAEIVPAEDTEGKRIPGEARPLSVALTTSDAVTTVHPDHYYVRKNGTRFPVAVTVTPIRLDGKTVGAIEVFHDVSAEKELEKMRTSFLQIASHQLRTPLSGTKWLIETLQRKIHGTLTVGQEEYLAELYNVNERMIRLVQDMLSFLRLESGDMQVKKEPVSVASFYGEMVIMLGSAAKNAGIVLTDATKDYVAVTVETDTQMLRTILESLVSNAIAYSKSGDEVVLGAKEEADSAIFFVKDTGIGIPKEEQRRVFEKFYRASNAKLVRPSGTGLGLAITVMFAEKIGGKVWFESEEGKGSTFYLRIPKKAQK